MRRLPLPDGRLIRAATLFASLAAGAAKAGDAEAACEKGDRTACHRLSDIYERGEGVRKDVARAAEYATLASPPQVGSPGAWPSCSVCRDLAACEALCRQPGGEPMACALAGQRSMEAHDADRAQRLSQVGCAAGSPESCTLAGTLFMGTMGGTKDVARATEFLLKACSLGEAAGCGTAGLLFVSGQLVEKDEERGARLLGKACALGYSSGCATLGQAYENGAGVPQDELRAAIIYERACEGGAKKLPYPKACATLADLYDKGKYLKGDRTKARHFYGKACAGKIQASCERLSQLQ